MKTNTWDTGIVIRAASLLCAAEPICTAALSSTISDLAVEGGSLPRDVRESLAGRMPPGYEDCATEGIDSLDDIRESLAAGNPVMFLESSAKGNLHWAVITGLERKNGGTLVRVANSHDRYWSTFRDDWSLNKVANGAATGACPEGSEEDAGLCYERCKPGYEGVGPVCWEQCASGYTDDGATCRRNGDIIESQRDCPWYDTCGLWHDCSWCPDGYANDGCFCRRDPDIFWKSSYGRGAGSTLSCASNQDSDAGLCYPKCSSEYRGVGPICWETCPAGYTDDGATCRYDSGVDISWKKSYGRGVGTPTSDSIQGILGNDDLGLVPFVAVRWCGSPQ